MKTELAGGGGVPAARVTSEPAAREASEPAARVTSEPREASDGRGTSAARVTSLPDRPLLVKPGLAKPAPVSSRASAAAASVAVVSDGESSSDAPDTLPTGGLLTAAAASEPELGSFTEAVSAFCGLTDLNGLSGFTGPSASGKRCGLVTLAGVNTLRGVGGVLGLLLPSASLSASGVARPFGAVASVRFSGLVNTEGAGSSDPVGDPF